MYTELYLEIDDTMTETSQPNTLPQPRLIKPTRRFNWRKVMLSILLILFLSPLLFVATTWILYGSPAYALQFLHYGARFVQDNVTKAPPFDGKSEVNILLLGADVSYGATRTDTIKLMHVDFKKKRIAMISIPRDTWVTLPNGSHGRINSAHALGGNNRAECIDNTRTTVQNLLSDCYQQPVRIDHVVRIQTERFVTLVDALGGIELTVEKRMKYRDPSQDLFIDLKPGTQHLTGYQAMCYVRFRNDSDGDYGRIRRQDYFIRTLAAQLQNASRWNQVQAIGPLMDLAYTDPVIEVNDVLGLKRLIDTIGMDGIESVTLPTVPTQRGAAQVVEVLDKEAAYLAMLEFTQGVRPTVTILNGTDEAGLGKAVSDQLNSNQYNVEAIGNVTTPVEKSVIFASTRAMDTATTIVEHLQLSQRAIDCESTPPKAEYPRGVDAPLSRSQIIIVLGADYPLLTASTPTIVTE